MSMQVRAFSSNASTSALQYTRAITRHPAKSLPAQALRGHAVAADVDYERLVKQHVEYTDILKGILGTHNVVELPALEEHPDCVFVEDTAVVVGMRALITRIGAPSRRGEEESVREALHSLGIETVDISSDAANIDGGDVLFTGRDLIVGISERTNDAGAAALGAAFPDVPVHAVHVRSGLHLKSVMTMCAPDVLLLAGTPDARGALDDAQKLMSAAGRDPLNVLEVPGDQAAAANCVYVNGHVLCRARTEYTGAHTLLETLASTSESVLKVHEVEASEVEKVDGALTCCSILVP